jgi:hypothetical protein
MAGGTGEDLKKVGTVQVLDITAQDRRSTTYLGQKLHQAAN